MDGDEDAVPAAGEPLEEDRLDELLHPGNEGHDAERQRDRLEKWAAQEDDEGPDARALREAQELALAAGVSVEEVLPLEPPTPPPPRGPIAEVAEELRYRREERAPPYGKRSREK